MEKEKINFNSYENQKIKERFVDTHIIYNQSYLVEQMLRKSIFCYDDIENEYYDYNEELAYKKLELSDLYYNNDSILDKDFLNKEKILLKSIANFEDLNQTRKDIFEWYIVSKFLQEQIIKFNESYLLNDYDFWWGRCETGQSIIIDDFINEVCYDIEILDGQKYSWRFRS